ncbi:MAG: glycosyltransferase family 1 protein [Oscillatoriophycideae cyanobacterium NC_groundwater_1537_Pr4_S-0.65um_50_18]|nr:glycosyltransferase family 1 protein [Oscillatoriophycideae cyanobacterium NC_groundwater_1537_Pr4_S-0.65um_50_18]
MSRVVLTTIGSLGDLHPMLAIGLALRERGHEVVFAVSQMLASRVEALGFEVYPMRPEQIPTDDTETIAQMMDLKKGTERLIRDYIFANLRETYQDLMAIAQGADFILTGEVVYATRLVAEKLGLKWAFCALSPSSFFSIYDPPVLPMLAALANLRSFPFVNRSVRNLVRSATRDWAVPLHQLRQELGLLPIGNPIMDEKFSPHLVLALFSSVLATPQPDWPSHTVQTGFTFYDGALAGAIAPELQHFLQVGEPPIVFTLGSAAVFDPGNFFRDSIQAVQQIDRRAVLIMGQNPYPENLPDSILAWDYVLYSAIFPHAGAIVHQGGIGTTAQALRAGRPTLVMPYSHDQPDNAARLERLGTSRTIPRPQYQPTRVAKELHTLLKNPSYATQAQAMSQKIQTESGAQAACDAIEKQLEEPNLC